MREQDERTESIFRQSVDAEKNKTDLMEKRFAEERCERRRRLRGRASPYASSISISVMCSVGKTAKVFRI